MRVVIFGATGMVGQGVLRECLLDDGVEAVLVVGRTPTGRTHPKLTEIVHADLYDLSPLADRLTGLDACLFCLGVSSTGMAEAAYTRVTYDLTMAVAATLAQTSPGMRFLYVSGTGTDSTERGRSMWARVKGRTENALLAMPFDTYLFRPGFIQPMHGIVSKTGLYRAGYAVSRPLYPVLRRLFPSVITTTEKVGRAMVRVARDGARERVLGNREINIIAA
ncbi:NAD(P)H-binding protein [Catellatospora sp. TT07R-123]|uniref:NAD(P)H-binding protein n=1 Tax=Catellatospora sp. TT07R-123 TaxID=2733863 RepID=UPI001BB31D59|nr:NAD(P)H-binding protein [Catellatospora sp. TT07R-123]